MVALLTAQLAFLSPERLLILLVIPLVVLGYIFATRRKNRRGMRFTNTSMLDVVVPKQSQWRRHVAVALSLLSLITLLDDVMATPLAALIVTVLWAVVALVLASAGRKSLQQATPPVPQTVETVKEDIQWAKNPTGSAPR